MDSNILYFLIHISWFMIYQNKWRKHEKLINNNFGVLCFRLYRRHRGRRTLGSGSKVLKQIGVPIYPAAKYLNGTTGGITSFRFATSDNVKKVRDWYREKFPQWAINSEYGSWILYNGKPGGGPAEYMSKNQIMVLENKNLQQWFGLPASMTTEIVITHNTNRLYRFS